MYDCGYDKGDCSSKYCAKGCTPDMPVNDECNRECDNEECGYDNYKCWCDEGCSFEMQNNNVCDAECSIANCYYDYSDCVRTK